MKRLLVVAFLMLSVSGAYSASMQAPSIGARATGMGGAFVGVANDPSSLFWNPAGLALCEGTMLMKGSVFIAPYSYYEAEGATDDDKSTAPVQMIPNIFFTHNFNDTVSMGLGYYIPFGLGQRWEDDATLRFNSTRSEISLSNLQAGASFRLADAFIVGAGLANGFSKMNTKSYSVVIPDGGVIPAEAYVKTWGEGSGMSGNVGFLWLPSNNWTLGGVWRSETNIKFKGDVDIGSDTFPTFDREISMDFTFPQTVCLGISYSGFDRWLLSGQIDWVNWSRIDTITQELDNPVTFFDPTTATVIVTDEVEIARDWKDRYILRIGAEYEVTPEVSLRAGYMWDPTPIPPETLDPLMFDVSTNRFFVGASFPIWVLNVDVAYAYSQGIKAEADDSENVPPTDGDYWGHSHMFEISTTYIF
ncbi:MAG: outer membrane protein transport protein [Candidatus Ratteibacteria bacterium]|nr:outer membrane protein transport protein [Candidatus Ratteibacteria bacterium]